jgi:hypothetical protein
MELTEQTLDGEPDAEGWVWAVLSVDGGPVANVGQLRPVEGAETWFDARVFGEDGVPIERRFMSQVSAILAMSLWAQTDDQDTRRALGWP